MPSIGEATEIRGSDGQIAVTFTADEAPATVSLHLLYIIR